VRVSFDWSGLELDAEVDFSPVVPARTYGPPEDCSPEEGGELFINALTIYDQDAMFLLDNSAQADSINDVCYEACDEAVSNQAADDFDPPDSDE
jgi:hypothetical protein